MGASSGDRSSEAPEGRVLRVVVADDHEVVRKGIVMLLNAEADIEVVGEAGLIRQIVSVAREGRADVVVLDLELPDGKGLSVLPTLRHRVPGVRVVVLSLHADAETVTQALGAGADGYVPKEASSEELAQAIRAVAGGQRYLAPSLGAMLAARAVASESERGKAALAAIDERILRLVAVGHTNAEIAEQLKLHPRNVERRRIDAMHDLGLDTRAELVQFALRQKWM